MRKSILVVFFVAAAVFAMGVTNGHATGSLTAVEKYVTLSTPLCLDTMVNSQTNEDALLWPDQLTGQWYAGVSLPGRLGDGYSVYPFQDQYGLTIAIPLGDFAVQAYDDFFDVAVDNMPFNAVEEFKGKITVTVFVQRDPLFPWVYDEEFEEWYLDYPTAGQWTQALKFDATMGIKRQSTVKAQFQYLNSFARINNDVEDPNNPGDFLNVLGSTANLVKRNQIVDNFHVNWNKSTFLMTLSGLRYHNFGPENRVPRLLQPIDADQDGIDDDTDGDGIGDQYDWLGPYHDLLSTYFGPPDAPQAGPLYLKASTNPTSYAKLTPYPWLSDNMRTLFGMDTIRTLGVGRTSITSAFPFYQNIRIQIDTSYVRKVDGETIKHTYRFTTSSLDDEYAFDTEVADDLELIGATDYSAATVRGCDGFTTNKESGRVSDTSPLIPLPFGLTFGELNDFIDYGTDPNTLPDSE